MIERRTTWAEVVPGVTVLTAKGQPLLVVDQRNGWLLMEDRNRHKIKVPPKPADGPVTVLEMTEEEALYECQVKLGAHRYLDFEAEARVEQRARHVLVPPLVASGRYALDKARDHVDWYHGTYAGPAEKGGFKTLKQILAAHDEMHRDLFMDIAHTHKEA